MTLSSATAAVLHGLAITYALWLLYVLVMGLYRAKLQKRLSRVALVLGFPVYAIGYLLDVFVQMTVASVLFLELPREGLVTGRLTRHIKRGHGWRRDLARWICFHLLDPFDPNGTHCD